VSGPEEFKSKRTEDEQVDYFYLAIVVSLVVHLFGMLAWNVEKHYHILPKDLFSFLHKVDPSRLLIENKEKAQPKMRQVTLRFVDVNPEVVSTPPKNPQFEGARSSKAANEAPKKTDQGKPKLDGKETEMIRDRNASLPSKPTPPPPAPKPPTPTPPKKVEKKPEPPKPKPKAKPKTPPQPKKVIKVAELKQPKPAPKAPPAPKPQPKPKVTPAPAPPKALPKAPPKPPAQSRPRSLNAARKNAGLPGEKSKMDGGVKNIGKSALDVLRTEFGEYGEHMSRAISARWHQLLSNRRPVPVGRVRVTFRVHQSGRVSALKTTHTDVNDISTAICQMAIRDPSPYKRWPTALLRRYPNGYHDVTITFIHR